MRFITERLSNLRTELDPPKQALLAWVSLAFVLVGGVVLLAASTRGVRELSQQLASVKQDAAKPGASGASSALVSPTQPAPSAEDARDFVSELPAESPNDAQIRYAAKLAHELHVVIVQMQAEPLKADPKTLGQTRLTLQLRGDYRDIKNVWIALIEKYPGLVLERMTIRHHDAMPAAPSLPAVPAAPVAMALSPTDAVNDEATLEMIQYTRPSELRQ